MSVLVLQPSWWGRESWLLCLICLPGVSWWLRGSYSRYHGVVCGLWLWYFLIILIYYFCFDGDCSRCSSHSVVRYGGVTKNWWARSMFLASNRLFNLDMNDNDKQLLLEILKKLSVAAVEQMKLYTDTQKCEAVNWALSVSLPKNVKFSSTMEGRASSAIYKINNDSGTSSIKKCESAGIELSTRAKRALRSFDVEEEYSRDYATLSEVVKHKLI